MNLDNIMKQAQQLQEKVTQAQQELSHKEFKGEAGAGMVQVVMTGRYDVKKITIAPEMLNEELSLLEDVLAGAINDCVRKVEVHSKDALNPFKDMLPDGFNMPFGS